jgi:hypothetical protein
MVDKTQQVSAWLRQKTPSTKHYVAIDAKRFEWGVSFVS